ncbi:MAG: adenylosuccinate lyase [Candidatus Latescibacteria bacterium]|nr:adenylosuccinate lyase [Candidatus Latescibacterota bacterium]
MIPRYSRPEMAALFEESARYRLWLDVELAVCGAMERRGLVPSGATSRIRSRARVDADRIGRIEETVRHDVIAFLTQIGETAGEDSRHLHKGMTSSDLVDTALALALVRATDLLMAEARRLREAARTLAVRHKETVMVGRTHGIHAEPVTFGLKVLVWFEAAGRAIERLARAREGVAVGKLSGAVGTHAHLSPDLEEEALASLGLKPEPAATQIVQRDRHAALLQAVALLGAVVEQMALEIRHLQRTEVREAEEPFREGQKGSSAMPHKRNPVSCERICGLSRILRANAHAALENVALWHERDISHSSVERVILPDSFLAADFMVSQMREVLEGLKVDPERMKANLDLTRGLIYSQRVLLALVESGMSREEAYALVQRHAMDAWKDGPDLPTRLLEDPAVTRVLPREALMACFDPRYFIRHVNQIFERILGEPVASGR